MNSTQVKTRLVGLGTALPTYFSDQAHVYEFMRKVAIESIQSEKKEAILFLLEKIYFGSGIENRHSVLSDFIKEDPDQFTFFPKNWKLEPFPTTEERMCVYQEHCVVLAKEAADQALQQAKISPQNVTHLVITTCTGFFSPGPDVFLIQSLGLLPTVDRTLIGFMGCCAGFNGIKLADQIIRSNPNAVVLEICIELCSIHFQKKPVMDLYVANCLFADGCSAAVFCAKENHSNGLADVVVTHSEVAGNSLDHMAWHVGNHGFEMRLKPSVPEKLRGMGRTFIETLAHKAGLTLGSIQGWAIHPGGRKIVDALQESLGLSEEDVFSSRRVLADNGNMSSATLFFVLKRELETNWKLGPIAALGFGPGLTVEGAIFTR